MAPVIEPGASVEKILFVPDTHRPYHDKVAWALMLGAARELRPDVIVVGGDFADCYAVSDFGKDPNRQHNLEWEIEDVNVGLDELDKLGAKRKIFVEGNHEFRLQRFLSSRAPELYNMLSIPELFRLKQRGWTYVPYKQHIRIGKLHVTHDTGRAGRYAHYQSQADFGGANVIIFHTHRIGYMVEGSAQGVPHVGVMVGHLLDVEQVDYMHRIRAMRDWALGFGFGLMEPNGNVHIQPVPIVGGTCSVGGKLFKAKK